MADFFSDSDGEKAVEELLSQAMDSTILEQVAAINCAGFTDSGLPSQLETRFQRLKSFPSSTPKAASLSTKSFNISHPAGFAKRDPINEAKNCSSSEQKNWEEGNEEVPTTCPTKCAEEKTCLSDSGGSSFSSFEEIPRRKMKKKGRKPLSSPSSCEGFSSRSVSPPVKSGCFLCSPKKVSSSKKKNKEKRGSDLGLDCEKHDVLFSDLSNFSVNCRRKMMKKAVEEEKRVCREAEKIVEWAKQASARMDISGIEDEISDDKNAKFH